VVGGASVGSSRAFRLDPHTLPVRGPVVSGGPATDRAFTIERERAIVQRSCAAGPATLTVPMSAYAGVAVRIEPVGEAGDVRATVELLHEDPTLTLALVVADEPEDVAADWRAWGDVLGLPLLLIGQDGSVRRPVDLVGGVITAPTKPRRMHSYFAARRPRFLTRRKVGRPGVRERLSGREIIARN
jgi:hypothetical protein